MRMLMFSVISLHWACGYEVHEQTDHIKFFLSTNHGEKTNRTGNSVRENIFDPEKNTKVLIHGYMADFHHHRGLIRLRDAYMKNGDNVIGVDWSWWITDYYRTAKIFSRIVAKRIAKFIVQLDKKYKIEVSKFHLIGHSVGAHVAGMVGLIIQEHLTGKKIGRITGLDPASPGYLGEELKLSKVCAEFVDILHTDDYVFGLPEMNGHVDFFMNGGISQPACGSALNSACSHSIALTYWIEATLNKKSFMAIKCDSWVSFSWDMCCHNEKIYLGELVPKNARGAYYLVTSATSPFGLGEGGVRTPRKNLIKSLWRYIYSYDCP